MTRSKYHHYVPRWLLRRFCHSGETTNYYSKLTHSKGVHGRNIRSIFGGFHTNSIRHRNGHINDSLESGFYQAIDNTGASLVRDALRIIDEGMHPSVRDGESAFIAQLLYNQIKRSKDFQSSINLPLATQALALQGARAIEKHFFPLSEGERQAIFSPASLSEDEDFIRVSVLSMQGEEAIAALTALIPVFLIADGDCKFIASGISVAICEDDFAQHGRQYIMPIDPRVAISLLGNDPDLPSDRVVYLRSESVDDINTVLLLNSSGVAGIDRVYLKSLIDRNS